MAEISDARKKVKRIKNLPAMPDMVQKISRVVSNPDSTHADVAALIAQDQALSAKVLRMANSAFFGMSRKISSITQALILLGFDVIKGMVLSSAVFEMMKGSMDGLWEHSMGCAAAAKSTADHLGLKDAEEILIAGLLHDLGKVVLALQLPEETRQILALARSRGVSFHEAEQQLLDFTHADVGLWLAEHWNLPEDLADPIRFHHEPEKAKNAPLRTAIVHLADIIIRARGFGYGGDPFVPELSSPAWQRLGLSKDDFKDILERLEPKLENIQDYA